MTPRFLADADLNHKIVLGVRGREPAIDILSAHEGGTIGLADQTFCFVRRPRSHFGIA
jgi:hypothetical protein